jgi:hypothetical protein
MDPDSHALDPISTRAAKGLVVPSLASDSIHLSSAEIHWTLERWKSTGGLYLRPRFPLGSTTAPEADNNKSDHSVSAKCDYGYFYVHTVKFATQQAVCRS